MSTKKSDLAPGARCPRWQAGMVVSILKRAGLNPRSYTPAEARQEAIDLCKS